MRCFYHHDKEALGTCKNCSRGICDECFVDVDGHGLACKDRCEDEVRQIQALIERNRSSYRNVGAMQIRNAYMFGFFALILFALFVIGRFQTDTFLNYAGGGIVFLGLFFVFACVMNVLNARRLMKK